MSELPVGDPHAGYIWPDKSDLSGTGTLPQAEQDWHDGRDAARDADTQTVLDAEAEVVQARQDYADLYATEVHVSTVTPNRATVGDPDLEITVYGQNFDGTTQAQLGGMLLDTTPVSDAQVKAVLPIPGSEGIFGIGVFGCPDDALFQVYPA